MFQLFTHRTRLSLQNAKAQTRRLQRPEMGTGDWLIGILQVGTEIDSPIYTVLSTFNLLDVDRAMRALRDIVPPGIGTPRGSIPFSVDMNQLFIVLDQPTDLPGIDIDYVLAVMMNSRPDVEVNRLIRSLAVQPEQLRDALVALPDFGRHA